VNSKQQFHGNQLPNSLNLQLKNITIIGKMNVYSFFSRWNRLELLIAKEVWKEVKFIDRDPHWYTRRVKEAIHNNINRDSGIKIPEAWIPTIRKHNSRPTTKRTCEGTTSNSRNNNEDRNAPIAVNHHATNSDT